MNEPVFRKIIAPSREIGYPEHRHIIKIMKLE
jgi:hypothetical protein